MIRVFASYDCIMMPIQIELHRYVLLLLTGICIYTYILYNKAKPGNGRTGK